MAIIYWCRRKTPVGVAAVVWLWSNSSAAADPRRTPHPIRALASMRIANGVRQSLSL
jgi:hypothetical protein